MHSCVQLYSSQLYFNKVLKITLNFEREGRREKEKQTMGMFGDREGFGKMSQRFMSIF